MNLNIIEKSHRKNFLTGMRTLPIILAFVASTVLVSAANTTVPMVDIKFPVVELGNCKDTKDCHVYCEKPENILKCVDFGQKNGLISAEEFAVAHKFSDVLRGGGPGKCTDQITCKRYCDKTSNINECLMFAEKHELIPLEQLKEAKIVAKTLQNIGKLPGGCKEKKECEDYCSIEKNWAECLEFGKNSGLISGDTLKQIKEGFNQMPLEMKSCIIEKVGADAVSKIENDQSATVGPEIGSAIQNCGIKIAEEAWKQAPPEAQSCFKSVISSVIEKNKSGGLNNQNDFMQIVFQNCLPKGMILPSGAKVFGPEEIMKVLKNTEKFYGNSLPQKDLEDIKKMQEYYGKDLPSQEIEVTSGQKTLNLDEIKKLNENLQKNLEDQYKNLTPEEREYLKKMQEQGESENTVLPESFGGSSGMGL